jgi:hypothetical protein
LGQIDLDRLIQIGQLAALAAVGIGGMQRRVAVQAANSPAWLKMS